MFTSSRGRLLTQIGHAKRAQKKEKIKKQLERARDIKKQLKERRIKDELNNDINTQAIKKRRLNNNDIVISSVSDKENRINKLEKKLSKQTKKFEEFKENKQKEIMKYLQIICELESKLQTTIDDKNKYKCIVYGLKNAYLYGMDPRDNVPIIKGEDGINSSLTVMEWKKEETNNIIITNHNQNINNLIKNELEIYINNNNKHYNYDNPLINIDGTIKQLKDIVDIFIISSDYRIPSLYKQKGVKAKQEIAINTIIGQYKGNEYEEQEWHNKFDYTNCDGINEHYLYGLDWITINGEQRSITIDPIDANLVESPLIRINDCRLNIYNEIATKQDKQLQNCKFINCRVYGWPSTFIITTKKIFIGEELFINYGKIYTKLMHETKRWQQIVEINKNKINNLYADNIMDDKIIDLCV